jgi:hypothetical protein
MSRHLFLLALCLLLVFAPTAGGAPASGGQFARIAYVVENTGPGESPWS